MDKFKPVTVVFSKTNTSDLSKLHISLLILLKSELNMSEKLKIYISTVNNVLIDVNPHIEIPIKLEDFESMMEYVINKMKIKDDKGAVLMSVIKNKLDDFLPPNTYKLRLDVRGEKFEVTRFTNKSVALFFNLDEGEDMQSVRLSDYLMDSVGISGKIITLFN